MSKTVIDKTYDVRNWLIVAAVVFGALAYIPLRSILHASKLHEQINHGTEHWFWWLAGGCIACGVLAYFVGTAWSAEVDTLSTMNVMRSMTSGSRRRRRRMAIVHNKIKKRRG